jgi:hypothetical protein
MKRTVVVAALLAVLAFPAFSQLRIDIGVDVPMTLGVIGNGEVNTSNEAGDFLRSHIFPFPEASLYYQFSAGPLTIAPGVRCFTFIFESVLWPNVMAELELGPVFLQAQLGGLLFVAFGLYSNADFGQVLLPDLSAWVGIGKERRFRLGGGVIGLFLPDLTTSGMGIAPYLGGKIALDIGGE